MKVRKYEALFSDASNTKKVQDYLAIEQPLHIFIENNIWMITMQSPGDEEQLVRGLLFTEGVYKQREIEPVFEVKKRSEQGFIAEVNVQFDTADWNKSEITKRSLLSAASCGICGTTALKDLESLPRLTHHSLAEQDIHKAFVAMREHQNAFEKSGGSHAAALCNAQADLICVMEDIGRHNAVDKCIGAALQQKRLDKAKMLLVSGRVSYEIITKCFIAGVPILAAVSAPSSLAVDFAKELGITLYAFCREDRITRYA